MKYFFLLVIFSTLGIRESVAQNLNQSFGPYSIMLGDTILITSPSVSDDQYTCIVTDGNGGHYHTYIACGYTLGYCASSWGFGKLPPFYSLDSGSLYLIPTDTGKILDTMLFSFRGYTASGTGTCASCENTYKKAIYTISGECHAASNGSLPNLPSITFHPATSHLYPNDTINTFLKNYTFDSVTFSEWKVSSTSSNAFSITVLKETIPITQLGRNAKETITPIRYVLSTPSLPTTKSRSEYLSLQVRVRSSKADTILKNQCLVTLLAEPKNDISDHPVIDNKPQLMITPNPSTHKSAISIVLSKLSNVNISVYNILGQRIQTLQDGQLGAGQYQYNLTLPTGQYMICLTDDMNIQTEEIIFQ